MPLLFETINVKTIEEALGKLNTVIMHYPEISHQLSRLLFEKRNYDKGNTIISLGDKEALKLVEDIDSVVKELKEAEKFLLGTVVTIKENIRKIG